MAIHTETTKRHDFVLLFDVSDGNPNGDPDAGNLPRVDPETMQGLVTDVAIKRKVRDFVDVARGTEQRFKIYVQHGEYLTDRRARVFNERAPGRKDVAIAEARSWMCDEFFDVRMFGAVMSMKERNAGQVRGPVQLKFARSIDAIVYQDVTIVGPAQRAGESTRSVANEEQGEALAPGTMGRKAMVPYGLYRTHGFFNPHFARQTGVTEEDIAVFWQALQFMWDQDHSAARGEMTCRGLYVFSHESALGNAPSYALFDRIAVARKNGLEAPRKFADYTVDAPQNGPLDARGFPDVTLTRLVG